MYEKEISVLRAVLISCSIVLVVMIYFIITVIRQQRKKRQLYKEKLRVEINTLEKERKRIAADLHDELGPLLSSVRLQIQCVEPNLEEDKEIIENSTRHIDSILQRLREIANDLMPGVLLRKGLSAAVVEFSNRINNSGSSLKIKCTTEELNLSDPEKQVHIYRLVQEIIQNAIKHSEGNNMDLSIKQADGKILINASDNGKGFDYDTTLKNGAGLGLTNMISRVEMLKGSLDVKSRLSKGTSIAIEIEN